jgi:hypothetical protein
VDQAFQVLQNNADPPPAGNCGAPPDGQGNYTFGYGYVDVLAAVQACRPQGSLHLNKLKLNWAAAPRPGVYKLSALPRVHDQDHAPAGGATVFAQWTLPDGSLLDRQAATDSLGRAKFPLKSSQTGLYRFCVTGMSKPGYVYDPAANEGNACKSVTVGP